MYDFRNGRNGRNRDGRRGKSRRRARRSPAPERLVGVTLRQATPEESKGVFLFVAEVLHDNDEKVVLPLVASRNITRIWQRIFEEDGVAEKHDITLFGRYAETAQGDVFMTSYWRNPNAPRRVAGDLSDSDA